MSQPWILSNVGAAGAQAAATVTAPGSAGNTNLVVRLRSICATLTGEGGAATGTLVICSGTSNSATSALAVWSVRMAAVSGGNHTIMLSNLDIRANVGENLTVGFIAGGGGTTVESVTANGDLVQFASPAFFPNT